MFSEAELDDLYEGLADARGQFTAMRERCVPQAFKTPGGREHATHGLARRIETLFRCTDWVFTLLPPEMTEIPDRDVTHDATVNIQAFVMNAFGCCENLAWIWVYECDVRRANGQPLAPTRVGLGQSYPEVQASFSDAFRAYLGTRDAWFANLKDFRDALAHRIPLYIPPFMIDPADAEQYAQLEADEGAALKAQDFAGYAQLRAQKAVFTHFKPLMAHSLTGQGRVIAFHAQLLADFSTIDEMSNRLLDELLARP